MRGIHSVIALAWACASWRAVQASFTPYMQQSFFFEWDTHPVPIPVSAQCDVLHITWSRSAATGPNPIGPYYLQVYTSIYPTPFVIPAGDISSASFDWAVPFPPDTLFQICMFDVNGNTGGCQRIVTVIPANTTTPSCANVTFPATSLDVVGTVIDGPFSQYGWIPQCSDLELKPNNGTPPYIITIATTQHPPYNITSNNMNPVNWTVSISWASSFFVSVVDSVGNSWARGPLHSGATDGTDAPTCLSQIAATVNSSVPVTTNKSTSTKPAAAIGAGVGGVVTGLAIGAVMVYFCMRGRVKKAKEESDLREKSLASLGKQPQAVASSAPRPLSTFTDVSALSSPNQRQVSLAGTTLGNRLHNYATEPFRMPNEDGSIRPNNYTSPSEDGSAYPVTEPESQAGSQALSPSADRSHVYVVHHDGGRAPVTVFTPDGTEVVELPPRYVDGQPAGGSGSAGGGGLGLHSALEQTRDAGPTPRKPRGA